MRKTPFQTNNYYHIFNRGVDKRTVFQKHKDLSRFFQSMIEFNTIKPIGSMLELSVRRKSPLVGNLVSKTPEELVDIVCYCLNPNHYHFILRQKTDKGIERFMHRLGLGYSKYFNEKYKRSGSLFEGTFKALHIDSDAYLLYASAYVNLNNRVHRIQGDLWQSSWKEYMNAQENAGCCKKEVILNQFSGPRSYREFAENALKTMRQRKELEKLLKLDELGN